MRTYVVEDELILEPEAPTTEYSYVNNIFRLMTRCALQEEHPEETVEIIANIPEDMRGRMFMLMVNREAKDQFCKARMPWRYCKLELVYESIIPIKRVKFTFQAKTILEQLAGV